MKQIRSMAIRGLQVGRRRQQIVYVGGQVRVGEVPEHGRSAGVRDRHLFPGPGTGVLNT
jgi:hypothetical protein